MIDRKFLLSLSESERWLDQVYEICADLSLTANPAEMYSENKTQTKPGEVFGKLVRAEYASSDAVHSFKYANDVLSFETAESGTKKIFVKEGGFNVPPIHLLTWDKPSKKLIKEYGLMPGWGYVYHSLSKNTFYYIPECKKAIRESYEKLLKPRILNSWNGQRCSLVLFDIDEHSRFKI